MVIDLVELKYMVDRLFDHIIETRGIKHCEIDKNFFWNVPTAARYDLSDKPNEIDLGSLHDEWEFASNLKDPDEQPLAYQFTQLAPILCYIGEYLGEKLAKYGG